MSELGRRDPRNLQSSSCWGSITCWTVSIERKDRIKEVNFYIYVACVAGGIRERASGGGAAIFLAGKARKGFRERPRVKFPPATFRMGFACRPLLSHLMNQLNKPIREQSVTWNLRFISARNDANARDSSEINPWFTWRSPITRRNVLHSHLCTSCRQLQMYRVF